MSEIIAPMGGKVLEVKVNVGDTVNDGDEVIILEAMKMELPIVAEASGTVKEVKCKKGDAVEAEAVMIVLE
ncbi:MAG: acetyl-CoA carboxylase biotin carboxyl carrier protein subunit [Deltaproteobacteria bacterium]|nr:acetyl-CoA carboxylase biotin carboxyl carrier protein subunit [Deltaproteobacteria bacterium]MBW2116886.1 acetyl-CoA carboxylase biotin carboxyl carrier protein subunit [Deltaproteobacteria bacterium]MBW2343199.1 acetyl-CoA carboxylase biotin carboxyl carrier protein subunit [Deltaproteobacteria bacterium]